MDLVEEQLRNSKTIAVVGLSDNPERDSYRVSRYMQSQGYRIIRDSPDQTNFPGNSSFWDTVKYNPAFQGRQMRPDSLKFPVFI